MRRREGNKKNRVVLLLLLALCAVTFLLATGIGSVFISPVETANVLFTKLFNLSFLGAPDETVQSIIWKIRLPRAALAFLSGGGLAISGACMQSILKNPLASSYTLGVSSGAALGAAVAILFKVSIFGFFTLPFFGLSFGLLTVFLALGVAAKVDRNMQNNTIILTGMAFSLFANAMITVLMTLSREQLQQLVFWQMGSFALKDWKSPALLLPFVVVAFLLLWRHSRELDVMTIGDEQALSSGVAVKKTKWILLAVSAVLTGIVVSLAGIIGFVDLFTPHVARKLVGSRHRYLLPASLLLGGAFMLVCDLIARTITSPVELPVGAITSAIGAPFFIYLYFNKRKKKEKV